jgi:hypothetical protein
VVTVAVPAPPVRFAGSVVGAVTLPREDSHVSTYGVVPPSSHGHPVTSTSPSVIFERASRASSISAAETLNARAEVVWSPKVIVKVPPSASTAISCTSATAATHGVVVVTAAFHAIQELENFLITHLFFE